MRLAASASVDRLPSEDQGLGATAFYAGLRRGELQVLRGSDVDLKRSEIHLKDVAGSPELIFGRGPDQPFDPKTVGDRAKRSWNKANDREGEEGELRQTLRPMTLRECRHTFASLLIDAGVNPKAIQEFMGHATIEETFSRYGHLMPGARDQARELVDAYMSAATA